MSLSSMVDRAASLSRWRNRPVAEKACLGLGFLILAVSLPPWPGAALVGGAMLVITFAGARVPFRLWATVAVLPVGFLAAGSVALMLQIGPDGLAPAPGGVAAAGLLTLRALAATSCLLFLALTTPATDLLSGLRRLGVPVEVVEIALLTYRFVFLIGDTAVAMTHAQRARLGHSTRRRRLRSVGLVIANLLPRALDQARRMETGLAARGWAGDMRVLSNTPRASPTALLAIFTLQVAVAAAGAWLA